jgi:hypothetical protein
MFRRNFHVYVSSRYQATVSHNSEERNTKRDASASQVSVLSELTCPVVAATQAHALT